MKLNNEADNQTESASYFYHKYVEGMTPQQIGQEVHEDSTKLVKLYKDAIGSPQHGQDKTPGHIKFLRLINALGRRLSPGRRLILSFSVIGFIVQNLLTAPFSSVLLILSFGGVLFLLILELLEKFDAKREIDLARDIQLSLLPAPVYTSENLNVHSFASTASEVGGDYVDTVQTPRGEYYIIADVSGKGLSASLYMIRLQALFHLLVKNEPDPKQLLVDLNEFIKYGKRDKTFVTACVALAPSDGSPMLFCRAGHNIPLYYSKEKERCKELRSAGLALGMTNSQNLEQSLQQMELRLNPGDILLMYTDGLTEARSPLSEEYGENRLLSLFELYCEAGPEVLIEKIRISLEQFVKGTDLPDDVTFSIIARPIEEHEQIPIQEETDS